MRFFEIDGRTLIFRENGETVRIRPWGRDALRVESCFMGEIPDGSAALLTPQPVCGSESFQIDADDYTASIRNGRITAELSVKEWGHALRISFRNEKGEDLLREIDNGGALQKRARYYRPLPGGSSYLKQSFEADRSEKIYGMGQYQQEIMDLQGCSLELSHRNSQAAVPFCISSKGYGFLWNNAAVGEVHFGLNTIEWEASATEKCDYWITAGDTPAEILHHYADVTGKAPMMPEYGLGFWQCKLRYYNQEQVLRIAEEYVKRGIKPDVIVIDFYHWPRCGDWRFDEEYFPDPKAMVSRLHDLGIETMVSIWPQVDTRSENYEALRQQGLLVRTNGGIDVQMLFHGNNCFLDATNPRARKFAWKVIRKNYADLGIRTFWLDEAEPEFGTYDYEQYRFDAGPALQTGNIYPREYARLFYEGLKEKGEEEVVSLIRCACAGSQRYGALVWSGDISSSFEDFRKQICAGIHMGLAGIPWWTTDIGGFHGGNVESDDFKELLIRWFQFGAFCPVMRIHGDRKPFTPIINAAGEEREHTGADNEIWSYGPENEKIMTKFIRIRERMRDYTRFLMQEAHEKGDPVMRAVFYEFPEDPEAWDLRDEFMFGPDILVAPICHAHAVSRKVYLPKGARWTLATGSENPVYEGGQTVQVDAPIDTLPVFLRDGRQAYLKGEI